MLNYIKSEFYRNINTKGNYIFLVGGMAFAIFLNVALGLYANSQVNFPYGDTKFSINSFLGFMEVLMIICLPLVSIIYGQELKHHTLKNSISFGISRSQIYLGKFLMEIIICTINLVLISSAYVIAAYLMLDDSGVVYLKEFIQAIVGCYPLLLISLTASNCFYFIFDDENTAIVVWAIIMVVVPGLLNIAGRKIQVLKKIASYMPRNMIANVTFDNESERMIMSWSSQEGFIKCFIVGIIGVIIFYTLGLIMFNKKEIK